MDGRAGGGTGEAAIGEQGAHGRTRDAFLAFDDRRHLLEFEIASGGVPLQQREVAGASCAETEVVTDQQPARAIAVDQQLDEGVGSDCGKRTIEVLHEHAVDARSASALNLSRRLEMRVGA
jgi:hypothetical protein